MGAWRSALLLMLLGACASVPSPVVGAPAPSFNEEYFAGLVSPEVGRYEDAVLDYQLDSPTGAPIHITRCPQVDSLGEDRVAPSQYPLYRLLSTNCLALKRYTESRPAERTYFPAQLTPGLVLSFPATAVPRINDEDLERRQGKTLGSYGGRPKASVAPDGGVRVVDRTDELTYSLMARADFDGDGTEDLLVRVDWRALDAMGEGTELLLLSRTSADAPVTVSWRQ